MLKINDEVFNNPLLLGTARYPSLETLKNAVERSGVDIITVSLRRETSRSSDFADFSNYLMSSGKKSFLTRPAQEASRLP